MNKDLINCLRHSMSKLELSKDFLDDNTKKYEEKIEKIIIDIDELIENIRKS